VDVCVVLYRCDASRVEAGLRPDDRLIVVDNSHDNRGFGAGCNLAAARGGDELICFVNPDGDLTGECLELLERAFDDPAVVAAGPDLGPMNQPLLADGAPAFLSGCCLAVRRSAFDAAGGFDERFFMYGEDVDLSWKLRRLGRIRRVEEARFEHDWSPTRKRFRSLHMHFSHHLVVSRRHQGRAGVARMLRDAAGNLRQRQPKRAAARLTGTADYLLRCRRWA
jgi:GT2 family glycosyltransferase